MVMCYSDISYADTSDGNDRPKLHIYTNQSNLHGWHLHILVGKIGKGARAFEFSAFWHGGKSFNFLQEPYTPSHLHCDRSTY